ncbi:Metallo-dependent phosphatase-like protein [Sordaria brevicollis]|uniref:Metallo-dependent phosphatase-like protein n=1 Tax=Sordaria brevicollis TaxID=83679 RepID=A0AAE0UGM8_SORBR|nr:Metallo-dependent phosphatase-like protein [Sordaria brevicollis]
MTSSKSIKTSILILSDTHGKDLIMPKCSVDVAIHCGDLTEDSKMEEYRTTLELLKSIDAPLKLVIAGNHDFSLDDSALERLTAEATESGIETELMKKEFGDVGEARRLFSEASNVTLLDEGIHTFRLQNGASLTVYASPFTPSLQASGAYQFRPDDNHDFSISLPGSNRVDVAITHCPPKGLFDRTSSASPPSVGCPQLFAAIAKARPRLHCFGHIHENWGAKLVTWRGKEPTNTIPSHLTEIDNGASKPIDCLANYKPRKFESEQDVKERKKRVERLYKEGCRRISDCPIAEKQTLFVNAALDVGPDEDAEAREHVPWIVELELPSA